tara:strand:+ start:161 stop:1204 length:1044 start_codon:yes stop_codon:yes gene_type:complete
LEIKEIQSQDFITGLGFKDSANFVFSEIKQKDRQAMSNNKEFIDLAYLGNKDDKTSLVRSRSLDIQNNQTIFTHSDLLEDLFNQVEKIEGIENLKIVTHMSDKIFNKKTYKKIPKQVSKVYSVNLDFKGNKVSNIPLGLANEFSEKNLHKNDFTSLSINEYFKNEVGLYLNFNPNTNYKIRHRLYSKFDNYNWVKIGNHDLSKDRYKEDLKNSTFVLCPGGNGPDTHRVWETLYSGSIPVVTKSITLNAFHDLPILFVDSFEDVTYEKLENYLLNLNEENLSLKKLSLIWWRSELLSKNNQKAEKFYLETSNQELNNLKRKLLFFKLINKIKKSFNTILRKSIKKFL